MANYLLDTNIFSHLFYERTQQANHPVKSKLEKALRANAQILVCPVVFYEIVRGLYQRDTRNDLEYFLSLIRCFKWCQYKQGTWDRGARLWADARKNGTPTGHGLDKDVLIAAQVREQDAILITGNIEHFKHFNITYENWLAQKS